MVLKIILILILAGLLQYVLKHTIQPKVHYNNYLAKKLLFKNYSTIMLFGQILTKHKQEDFSEVTARHETIHAYQWLELFALFFSINVGLFIGGVLGVKGFVGGLIFSVASFYIFYLLEWLVSCITGVIFGKISLSKASRIGYNCSMFETEAYGNQDDKDYIDKRIPYYGFLKYFGLVYKK